MTTINPSNDLLRLLRGDSAVYAEARRLILSDELLALPERFASLSNRVDNFIDEQRVFEEERRAANAALLSIVEEQRTFNEERRAFTRRTETAMGDLRGSVAYLIVRERADEIAEELGFTVIDVISGMPLRELFRSNPPTDFTVGDRRSFYHADLIMW